VLGVGRSGTSLAMQALETLGVRVSENMIPPNVSNPKGFYEDADIVEIHKHLLNTLTPNPSMPLREGWMNTPKAKQALKDLKVIVEAQVTVGPEPWAFKDPRTSTFLPLWIRLFNQLKIAPRFVLALRHPQAIIESFAQQYGNDQASTELTFLLRTLDALYYTGGDCHFLPYEHWFKQSQQTFQQLADFVFDQPMDISGKEPPVSEQLNRSQSARVELHNPLVRELYQQLEVTLLQSDNRKELMECVHQQRDILAAFKPWCAFAANQKNINRQEKLHDVKDLEQKLKICQKQLRRYTFSTKEYQAAIKALEYFF